MNSASDRSVSGSSAGTGLPFGFAVFLPLFTNQIAGLITAGVAEADAAVRAIHSLGMAELLCVATGIAAVLLLPTIHKKGEKL